MSPTFSQYDDVNSNSSTDRVIAAILLIFVLGLLCVSAQSTSHEQFKHSHYSEHSHHADEDLAHTGDDGAAAEPLEATTEHLHQHDPSDHTHDIPLRMVLTIIEGVTFIRDWRPRSPMPPYSAFFIPLERPPKPPHFS